MGFFDKFTKKEIKVLSPMQGKVIPIESVPDDTFADKIMGDGVAVLPTDDIVRAPADGTISFVAETNHAFGISTKSGLELLIHIGIDTVKLDGKGFELMVSEEQEVKVGDPVLKMDLEYLSANAPSLISPVICTELDGEDVLKPVAKGDVSFKDVLFIVEKK